MKLEDFFNTAYLSMLFDEKLSDSRVKGIDKVNSESFKRNKVIVLETIVKKVLGNTYLFSPYIEVLKLKGRNSKPRLISIPTIRDRIVLLAIKEFLHKVFFHNVGRKMPNSYIRDIKSFIASSEEPKYYLKLDVEKFYDRIDHNLLLEKLRLKKIDPRLIELISRAVSKPTVPLNYRKANYETLVPIVGVPQGLAISNILAQIYLEELDNIFKSRQYFYMRYVDDIIILNDEVISKYRYDNIKLVLGKIKLNLNESKTEKGALEKGFTFLSYDVTQNKISIAEKNVQVFIRRIAGKFTSFKNGINNKGRRPLWLQQDERFKEVFLEELNEAITGIMSSKRNYGWLFYFSEITDQSLLFKLDKIIASFFITLVEFDNKAPSTLKKLARSFNVIKFQGSKRYLANYDNYSSIRRKRDFLIFRGRIDPAVDYSDTQIDAFFERYKIRQIRNVEKDVGYKYM